MPADPVNVRGQRTSQPWPRRPAAPCRRMPRPCVLNKITGLRGAGRHSLQPGCRADRWPGERGTSQGPGPPVGQHDAHPFTADTGGAAHLIGACTIPSSGASMAVDAARFPSGVPATVAPARDAGVDGPDHTPPKQNHPGPHERHLPDWYTTGFPDHHRRPPPSRRETSSSPSFPLLQGWRHQALTRMASSSAR